MELVLSHKDHILGIIMRNSLENLQIRCSLFMLKWKIIGSTLAKLYMQQYQLYPLFLALQSLTVDD